MNFCIYSSCCGHWPAETKPSTHSVGAGECVDLLSAPWLLFQQEEFMQKSIAHVAPTVHMMMIKVVERARGRNGSGRRGHDGRGQPRAAWAAAGSMEGPPVTDGAVGGKNARDGLSVLATFVTTRNGSRHAASVGGLKENTRLCLSATQKIQACSQECGKCDGRTGQGL